MGAPTAALAAFKVAVAGARGAFLGCQLVGVHCQAHRTSWFAPVESGVDKDAIQAFLFGLQFHGMAARHHHRAFDLHAAPAGYVCGGTQIFDAAVGARADEHGVNSNVANASAGGKTHVVKSAGHGVAGSGIAQFVEQRNMAINRHHLGGVGAPRDVWGESCCINFDAFVKLCAFVGAQVAPIGECFLPSRAARCMSAAF